MIINRMETNSVKIEITSEKEIMLVVEGRILGLDIDGLNELRHLLMHFWDANSLYQWTKEAIEERKRWNTTEQYALRSPFTSDNE